MIQILLVDDQPMFREGLASLLTLEADFEIIGEANHGEESIALAAQLQPDVILLCISIARGGGIGLFIKKYAG